MTLISIDGVWVIHEGAQRLRWTQRQIPRHSEGTRRPTELIVGHVWPESSAQASIRRQIEHGQRAVVVLDGKEPVVEVAREQLLAVPVGAERINGHSGISAILVIPPFTWLLPADRARGEAFLLRAGATAQPTPHTISPRPVVEANLIGSSESLRFVYSERPLAIEELRRLINSLYHPAAAATVPILTGLDRRNAPLEATGRDLLKAA